jgi:cyclic peptide transporter
MNISTILKKKSKWFYLMLVSMAILNSLWSSGILILINHAISNKPLQFFPEYNWAFFIGIILISFVFSRYFQRYIIRLTSDVVYEFELSILEKVRDSAYEDLERYGVDKVYTAMGDARNVSSVPQTFIQHFNSFVIVVCGLGYLFYTSFLGGLSVCILAILLTALYVHRNKKITKDLNKLRDMQNDFQRYMRDFLFGAKEVRMNTDRSDRMFTEFLTKNRDKSRELGINTAERSLTNELIGNYSWYIVIGLVLFALPLIYKLDTGQTTAYLVTVLYIIGPVNSLIGISTYYTRLKISLDRLQEFDHELNTYLKEQHPVSEKLEEDFERIRFENVIYEYTSYTGNNFRVGPLNIEIKKGEVIFITGMNGSGKSTFMMLLTGLFTPTSGAIYYNNTRITGQNLTSYCEKISSIFAVPYLFSENYDNIDLDEDGQFFSFIEILKMKKNIRIDYESNVVRNQMSRGQQKRLVLAYLLVENRPVNIMDEWAAEQDPHFRKYFYRTLLPSFKTPEKTFIIITHDDAYFDVCDRLLAFEFGEVKEITSQTLHSKPIL